MPNEYGNWHTIYVRFNRWCKNGVIDRIFEALQEENIIEIRTEIICIDSTSIKVHPDAAGARKSSGEQSIGRSKGAHNKDSFGFHVCEICNDFRLSAGNKHDAPEGRKLIESFYSEDKHYLLMDRAYEDNETRELAVKQGFVPVVPPKRNRKNPWEYDKELYKRRNEVERYFLRIKRFRRVFTRYDKLDVLYLGNLTLAMIFDAILM